MKRKLISIIQRYYNGLRNHIASWWYKQFLGHVGKNTVIRRHCKLVGDSLFNVTIGEGCDIDCYAVIECNSRIVVDGNPLKPNLKVGDKCVFGEYNHITAVNSITIGDNLLTGRFVLITDNSHGGFEGEDLTIHPSKRPIISKGEVVVGNNVWIGDKVCILPGVHIGDGCVIGANSVVTHDVPPYSMIAGIPAVVIRQNPSA